MVMKIFVKIFMKNMFINPNPNILSSDYMVAIIYTETGTSIGISVINNTLLILRNQSNNIFTVYVYNMLGYNGNLSEFFEQDGDDENNTPENFQFAPGWTRIDVDFNVENGTNIVQNFDTRYLPSFEGLWRIWNSFSANITILNKFISTRPY